MLLSTAQKYIGPWIHTELLLSVNTVYAASPDLSNIHFPPDCHMVLLFMVIHPNGGTRVGTEVIYVCSCLVGTCMHNMRPTYQKQPHSSGTCKLHHWTAT